MKLRDKINEDLTAAMRAKDAERLSVLRMMKTAVKNKEVDARKELDDSQVIQVMATLIKQRRDSIEQFTRGGRPELAAKEQAEIEVIEQYLPEPPTDEEVAVVIDEAIQSCGATSAKDMGRVMKECMTRLAGKPVDGKKVSSLVHERLESLKS